MNFLELAKRRYSCRIFKPVEVEKEKLIKVLEAARVAPSAVNFQPWHFFVVQDAVNKAKVIESYPRDWIRNAPVLIVACGNHVASWKRADGKDHLDIDMAIAIDHLVHQATELGLGTCWVCNFQASRLSEVLSLPSEMEPIAIIPLGYLQDQPDIDRHQTKSKSLEEIVTWELPKH